MAEELKPCPLCGRKLIIKLREYDNQPHSYWLVMYAFISCGNSNCLFKIEIGMDWQKIKDFLEKHKIKNPFKTENSYISYAATRIINAELRKQLTNIFGRQS